jgi:predicted O-linked N-acetylglucosamine transferase (SPINDLY family)
LPEIAQAPCASSGRFVFGCFNNLCKVTPAVIQIWAALLARVPHARLLLNSWELRQAAARDRYAGLLREAGIAAGRVDLHPGGGHFYFLDQYNLIDVALDPFPYSGGLSTCEALMMGVPVVTFPGERFCGRHATSHLTNAGLASWVAPDLDGYVDLAVGLARDPGAVVEARAALRDRTLRSRLCDAGAHARAFTRALTQMCGPNPPGAP